MSQSPPTAATVSTIEPMALNEILSASAPAELLLLQVTSNEVFAQAHLPGAVLVTPKELVSGEPPAIGRLPTLAALNALFRRIGYTPEADVIVYDDEGGGWAGRMGWTLDVIGHRSWRYLNGGLQAWHGAGLAFATGLEEPPLPSKVELAVDTTPIADLNDVLAAIDDPDTVIWDVRSAEEYRGEKQAAARSGHVPGAVNYDWLLLKDHEHRLRANLGHHLAAIGVESSKRIITHCQTHHRSGLSYMVGRLLNFDIRAYHGSWSEWGNREDTPIEVGEGHKSL